MKKTLLAGLATGLIVFGITATSQASSIEIVDFDAGSTFLNFDELSHDTIVDIEYSSLGVIVSGSLGNEGGGSASDIGAYSTGGASSQPIYLGQPSNGWNGSVIFNLSTPTTQFGGILVDSHDSWLSVYDTGGSLIETVYGSGDVYDFVGIDTGSTNIGKAIFSGQFYAVDDVRFNSGAPVPEPATMLLMGTGLAGLIGARRKKKA